MSQLPNSYFTQPQNWEDNIQQIHNKQIFGNSLCIIDPQKFVQPSQINEELISMNRVNCENSFKTQQETFQPEDNQFQQKLFSVINQDSSYCRNYQNQSKYKFSKRQQHKASQYSKNYRQKNKQKIKRIQEQNIFLKKKVDDLQNRLREAQLELNRMKFSDSKEQCTIHKLSQQLLQKLTIISDVSGNQHQIKQVGSNNLQDMKRIQQFSIFYDEHGFGGPRKKQILEYHMNQLLENVMRDRQKYYFLTCVKKTYLSGQLTPFQMQIADILMETQEQKKKNTQIHQYMQPVSLELVYACKQLYKDYQKVVKILEKIHQGIKIAGLKDINEIKSQSRGATWFQLNQYRKQMRNLRAEWIDLVKNNDEIEIIDQQTKKKKNSRIKK